MFMDIDDVAMKIQEGKYPLPQFLAECNKHVDHLSGDVLLRSVLRLSQILKVYVSERAAEDLIDKGLATAEATVSADSSLLMGEKAFFCFKRSLTAWPQSMPAKLCLLRAGCIRLKRSRVR